MNSPLVFIHGIKGATLADVDGNQKWLTGWQAAGLSTPELSLPITWLEDGSQARDGLQPREPLSAVKVLPPLIQEQVYGPWIEALRKSGVAFHPFAYDWRRDNLETVEAFKRFIESVRRQHDGVKVRVVAHSMGGLITLALLNEHPEHFDSVVFAGVPFAGGISFLKDMHEGKAIGLNRKILSPSVYFTYPSVYTLFPLESRGLVEKDGTPIPVDFFSAADWQRLNLGVFAAESPDTPKSREPGATEFLQKALSQAKNFRQRLIARKDIAYPPILVITNQVRPTLLNVMRGGPESRYGWDFESANQAPGDGRVVHEHSLPPEGIPYQKLESEAEHSKLLNDPKVIDAVLGI